MNKNVWIQIDTSILITRITIISTLSSLCSKRSRVEGCLAILAYSSGKHE
jgi:hypothetical protein